MTTVTSTLKLDLTGNLATNAKDVAAALAAAQKKAAELANALSSTGTTDKMQVSLKRLKAELPIINAVHTSWAEYAKGANLAAKASDWTKGQTAAVKEWERTTLRAIRSVQTEESALARTRARLAQQQLAAMAKERYEREEMMRHGGFAHYAAQTAAGAVSAHGVIRGSEYALLQGAELQRERISGQMAGMSPELRQRIGMQALALSAKYPSVSQVKIMEMAKEARSVLNTPEEMFEVLETLVKAKAVIDATDSSGQSSEGLNLLLKGAENLGAGKDPGRIKRLINGYVQGMQVMGKTVNPEEIFAFDKNARSEGARLSDRFLMTTAMSVMQEMGGPSSGKAVGQFAKQLLSGLAHQTVPTLELMKLGLIDRKNVRFNKMGEVSGVKAGVLHAVKDSALLASDPDLWIWKDLLSAMQKHGVTKVEDQIALAQKILPGNQAADFAAKIITQRGSYEAHAEMYESAAGVKGADLLKKDAFSGVTAFTTSFGNLLAQVTSPLMEPAAGLLYKLADGINAVAKAAKDHPAAAAAGGAATGAAALGLSGLLTWKAYKGFTGLFGGGAEWAVAKDVLAKEAAGSLIGRLLRGGKGGSIGLGLDVLSIIKADKANGNVLRSQLREMLGIPDEPDAPASSGASGKSWWQRIFGSVEDHSIKLGEAQESLKTQTESLSTSFAQLASTVGAMGGGGLMNASFGTMSGARLFRASYGGGGADGSGASSAGHAYSLAERIANIKRVSEALGDDPNVALRVARGEGLRGFTGDHGWSHGDFQLFSRGGLGNVFKRETGLDPADPKNELFADEWALRYAHKHGWGDWHGAARAGIFGFHGINRHAPGKVPPINRARQGIDALDGAKAAPNVDASAVHELIRVIDIAHAKLRALHAASHGHGHAGTGLGTRRSFMPVMAGRLDI